MQKLQLETDYTINGNSTGTPLDTLAIAMTGGDYNSIEEYNWDYLSECEQSARSEWLGGGECEKFFQKTLTGKQLNEYADNLTEYNKAFEEYCTENFEDVRAGDYDPKDKAQKALADEMEKWLTSAQKDLWRDWLHGDYRGNFDGVLPTARREWGIDFEEENGEVYADITKDFTEERFETGEIDRKTQKAAREWLEIQINYLAIAKYQKEQQETEKRRTENEKTRIYKKEQQEKAEERKRKELLALAS